MQKVLLVLLGLACAGHARRVQSNTDDAREWELENIARHQAGEMNLAELGMANLAQALRDPEMLAEMRQMLHNPENAAQLKRMVADPFFQEQVQQIASPENLAHLNQIMADQIIADQQQETPPEAWGWTVFHNLVNQVKSLLSPSYEYAKVETDIFGSADQQSGWSPGDETWRTARKKINNIELPANARSRVLRDLRRLKLDGQDLGVEVEDCEVLTDWVVKMVGAPNTVYEGEIYRLRFRFHPDYPVRPPEVVFMRPAPVHEHIYSDGKICLSVLYSGWRPEMDVKSTCLSILSMLSSAKAKKRPPDNNSSVAMSQGQNSRQMTWEFHDDDC